MKTRIFISALIIALLSTVAVSATEPERKVYHNIETSESGIIKEFVSFKKDNIVSPERKYINSYGTDGELQKKVMHYWSDREGWIAYKKYVYEYNDNKKVANLTYTEWDKKLGTWSPKSIQYIHIYDDNGNFLSMKKVENNEEKNASNSLAKK